MSAPNAPLGPLLRELLADVDSTVSAQLRAAAKALGAELPPTPREHSYRAPANPGILACAYNGTHGSSTIEWLALTLEGEHQAAVDVWQRATPYNYTATERMARLANYSVTSADDVAHVLRGFARILALRGAVAST